MEDSQMQEVLLSKLKSAKAHIIQLGILNMNQSNDDICRSHNIWLVLYLLKNLNFFDWNEFWLALKIFIEDKSNISDFKSQIQKNRLNEVQYIAINKETGQQLADTTFTYIRSLLKEANIIEDTNNGSRLTKDGLDIVKTITLWI